MKRKLFAVSPIELRAAVATESDSGAVRLREMVFYAGTPVYRFDFWSGSEYMLKFDMRPQAVDMSRMANAPVLADHMRSTDRVVGVVEKAWLEGGKGRASFRLADTPDADIIRQKVDDGIIRQVSMEATVQELEDVTPKKSRMKEFLATKWTPAAVALVPVGADPGAQLLADEGDEEFWLSEGLYVPRPADDKPAETGAASQQQNLLAMLLQRRQYQQ